jgi:hypothetical protein
MFKHKKLGIRIRLISANFASGECGIRTNRVGPDPRTWRGAGLGGFPYKACRGCYVLILLSLFTSHPWPRLMLMTLRSHPWLLLVGLSLSGGCTSEKDPTTPPLPLVVGQSHGGGIIFYLDDTDEHGLLAAGFCHQGMSSMLCSFRGLRSEVLPKGSTGAPRNTAKEVPGNRYSTPGINISLARTFPSRFDP